MKTIKQIHHITATAEEVYIALTNPFTIELWTGYQAIMSTEVGSEFSLFEGDIVGKNLEFVENQLIRQQWYFEGEGKDSIVSLRLKADRNRTLVELIHENVPEDVFEEMETGWKKTYMGALKDFFR